LVHYQTSGWPQPHSRIENVYGNCVFEIEPVQGSCCTHTWDGPLPHEQVEGREATCEVWLGSGVDAVPDADQATLSNLHAQLLSGHNGQQLRRRGEASEFFQQSERCRVHAGIIDADDAYQAR
jgi:hypothetical protein